MWGVIAVGLAVTVVGDRVASRSPLFAVWWYGALTILSVAVSALEMAAGEWGWGLWTAVCAVANGVMWWNSRNRRRRKRAAALIGAKSRAVRDALVRKVRERATPRRVLRPVPGGAR